MGGLPSGRWRRYPECGPSADALALGASAVLLGEIAYGVEEAPSPMASHFAQGVRNGMQDLGLKSLKELHAALKSGDLRMECRTDLAAWAVYAQAAHHGICPQVT